jgi:hypothetical protein
VYHDTEQSYLDFTLDVYEWTDSEGVSWWVVDWWKRYAPGVCGQEKAKKKRDAVEKAKEAIRRLA